MKTPNIISFVAITVAAVVTSSSSCDAFTAQQIQNLVPSSQQHAAAAATALALYPEQAQELEACAHEYLKALERDGDKFKEATEASVLSSSAAAKVGGGSGRRGPISWCRRVLFHPGPTRRQQQAPTSTAAHASDTKKP
jgi:hypothetical protein